MVNAFALGWLKGWISSGWKTADNKPVKNEELWRELVRLTSVHLVQFNKVKGHADDELNNRCDKMARGEVDKILSSKKVEIPQ